MENPETLPFNPSRYAVVLSKSLWWVGQVILHIQLPHVTFYSSVGQHVT